MTAAAATADAYERARRAYAEAKPDEARAKSGSNGRHEEGEPGQQGGRRAPVRRWPRLQPAALYGLPGLIVRTIEPHTEADPVGLLVNVLIAFGSAAGSAPHAEVEDSRHGCNLFAVEVGETSKGRKGTAWRRSKKLYAAVDEAWDHNRIMGGLASGEGLLYNVRDGSDRKDKDGLLLDEGVPDKRLLVIEEEFASTLKVMAREGNTLSTMLRQAWDSGELRTMSKNAPLKATGAHVSIIGHVTRPEVRRYLNETEMANGFANRFLWVCVKRSKELPSGGGVVPYGDLVRQVHDALEFARRCARPIARDAEADALWRVEYGPLSDERAGLVGAITSRAEAQVLRLSVIYAMMDRSAAVRLPHLQAALGLWAYCDDSATYIFGDGTGDPIADKILAALAKAGAEGLTATAISEVLGRNVTASRIAAALTDLEESALAVRREVESGPGGGRPTTVWMSS